MGAFHRNSEFTKASCPYRQPLTGTRLTFEPPCRVATSSSWVFTRSPALFYSAPHTMAASQDEALNAMYAGLKDTQPLRQGTWEPGNPFLTAVGTLQLEASRRRACAQPLCRHPFACSTESYNPSEGAGGWRLLELRGCELRFRQMLAPVTRSGAPWATCHCASGSSTSVTTKDRLGKIVPGCGEPPCCL